MVSTDQMDSLAERSIFINLVSLFWAFDPQAIGPLETDPKRGFGPIGISACTPYKVKFHPRRQDLAEYLGPEERLID